MLHTLHYHCLSIIINWNANQSYNIMIHSYIDVFIKILEVYKKRGLWHFIYMFIGTVKVDSVLSKHFLLC